MNISSSCCYYPKHLSFDDAIGSMRKADQQYYSFTAPDVRILKILIFKGTLFYSVISIVEDSQLNAILSIIRTVFVSIVLGVSAVLFSKDV
jgi:hypothetical protein